MLRKEFPLLDVTNCGTAYYFRRFWDEPFTLKSVGRKDGMVFTLCTQPLSDGENNILRTLIIFAVHRKLLVYGYETSQREAIYETYLLSDGRMMLRLIL